MSNTFTYICSLAPQLFSQDNQVLDNLCEVNKYLNWKSSTLSFSSKTELSSIKEFLNKKEVPFKNIPEGIALNYKGTDLKVLILNTPCLPNENDSSNIINLIIKHSSGINHTVFISEKNDWIVANVIKSLAPHKLLLIEKSQPERANCPEPTALLLIPEYKIATIELPSNDFHSKPAELNNLKLLIEKLSKNRHQIPKQKQNLPGEIWGITTFFNPAKYKNKQKNYQIFRKSVKRQGLNLLTIELIFDGNKFEINKEDAEILVQIKGSSSSIMWQKERLLNLALAYLPTNCDKIVWLDCDLIFTKENWVTETAKKLENYPLIQPYAWSVRLKKEDHPTRPKGKLLRGNQERASFHSIAYGVAKYGRGVLHQRYHEFGNPGYAWAGRREFITRIGFFDRAILGSADYLMALGFFGVERSVDSKNHSSSIIEAWKLWRGQIKKSEIGKVGYCPGTVLHLWHGDIIDRKYEERNSILNSAKFEFVKDLDIDSSGLWCWKNNNTKLKKNIENYFKFRREDSSSKWIFISRFRSKCSYFLSSKKESFLFRFVFKFFNNNNFK